MTYAILKRTGLAIFAALTLSVTLPTASAMAAEAPTGNFTVSKTTDGLIKLGVKAYKRGVYKRAVKMNEQALRSSLSKRKLAIAQSNLCASYAKLDKMDEAHSAVQRRLNYVRIMAPLKLIKRPLQFVWSKIPLKIARSLFLRVTMS